MKTKLILPLFILLGVVGCGGNNSTSNTSTTSQSQSSQKTSSSLDKVSSSNSEKVSSSSSIIDPSVIVDVPEEDKITPKPSDNFDFDDYNDTNIEYDTNKWYANELKSIPLPDPYVIEVDGVYYIYGTTDRTAARSVDCYSTEDFNNFTLHKDVFLRDSTYWSGTTTGIFAPEILVYDDMYYMYYSAEHKDTGRRYIDVVVSESPTGPFVGYEGENFFGDTVNSKLDPIFKHNDNIGLSVLDQTLFVDDDDKMYMYYSVYDTNISQYIVGFEMYDPVTPNWDTYKVLVRPGEHSAAATTLKTYWWEALTDFEVAEGPQMIKSPNGKYYLTYSVNHYPNRYYTVCYAESSSPLGDYTKPYVKNGQWTNLLFGYAGGTPATTVHSQWEGFMSGTAHHCFFKIGDQHMIGYHAHKNRNDSTQGRMFGMDKLFFDADGVPYCHGPSTTVQTLPEAISGYKNIALDARVYASSTITNPQRINDNFITEHYNLPQEKDREVGIPTGKSYIELKFDKEYEIGGIQIMNSVFFAEHLEEVAFINFFNGNAILDATIDYNVVDIDKEFIKPMTGITFDLNDFKADKVVVCFDSSYDAFVNEIIVLGK